MRIKLAHGLGAVAFGVKDTGFSTFLLIFYNQVLGIDAGLVGLAIMLALFGDAIFDLFVGEASDRTQTRWGRRLPWLYAAPIPLAIAWWLMWHPPTGDDAATLFWLFGSAIAVRMLVSCCEVPSIALVPELTPDYDERTRLMRYRFLFGWAGGLVILFLAYGVFFAGEGGITAREGYGAYALTGALVMAASVLLSAWGQHHRIARPSPPVPVHAGGFAGQLREMRRTLAHPAFLWLIGAGLFVFVNHALMLSLTNYMLAYLWRLEQGALLTYALLLFASVVLAFVLVEPLSRRWGKRGGAIRAGLVAGTGNALLYGSYVTGLFPGAPEAPSLPLFLVAMLVINAFAVMMMILTSSMMADVVEASEEDTGRRSEGLFFAGYFFMQKCATGIGIALAGQILARIGFPDGAQAGAVDSAIIDRLGLVYMIAALVIVAGAVTVMRRFPISRSDHVARVAARAERQRTQDVVTESPAP